MRVVVVGAGLAGAACASRLVAEGVHVVVLDKSRGPGGRTATRRATVGGVEVRFDHGSAVLQLDSLAPHVRSRVEQGRAEGVLVGWTPRVWRAGVVTPGDAVCIGIPGNNALAAHLLRGVEVRAGVTVGQVRAFSRGWEVLDVDGARVDEADAVVVAVPAPQAATLVREARPDWALPLADVPYAITVVGMAAWGHAPDPGWDVALGRSPDLARIVWQDGVPGRSAFGAFVVEAGDTLVGRINPRDLAVALGLGFRV